MKDNFEKELFQMAEKEQILLPKTMEIKVNARLKKLPDHKRGFKMNIQKTLILAAAMAMLFSITATAAAGALRQRMEEMNKEKLEEYFIQIYTSKLPMDNYNRPYMEEERRRMEELQKAYEEEARFPKGSLTMIDNAKAYKGKNVSFLKETSTFFFPEKEMSDEQLLQIIDFNYKRDYSLQKMNELINSGEADIPKQLQNTDIQGEPTGDDILKSQAVSNPDQALTIPYTGDLSLLYIAGGQDCIFLTGWNSVHKMEIGSSNSALFFDDFDKRTRVTALCQDTAGDIYLALMQMSDSGRWESAIWVLSKDGALKKKIDLTPYQEKRDITVGGISSNGFIRQMAVDDNGYLYIRGSGFKDADILLIIDTDGNLVSRINAGEYTASLLGGIGIGKDGRAYTSLQDDKGNMGIASVNPNEGTLENIYMGIVPEDTIGLDIVAPGYDADFIFWGYSGILSYNTGEECASVVMPAYETPCNVEGSLYCALPDGRIVLVSCTEYSSRQTENGGTEYDRIPEKTCFYYIPSLRKN